MSCFSSALEASRETQGQDKNLINKESISYHGLGAALKNVSPEMLGTLNEAW